MPVKWTEAADRNLLLVVVKSCNLNYAQIAEAYRKQYGNEKGEPTTRAVTEHLYKLTGVSKNRKATPAGRKPRTPKPKTSTPRAPPSSGKTSRGSTSPCDDSESEAVGGVSTPTPRVSLPRSSKDRIRQYLEQDDEILDLTDDTDVKSEGSDLSFEAIVAENAVKEEESFGDGAEQYRDSPFPSNVAVA